VRPSDLQHTASTNYATTCPPPLRYYVSLKRLKIKDSRKFHNGCTTSRPRANWLRVCGGVCFDMLRYEWIGNDTALLRVNGGIGTWNMRCFGLDSLMEKNSMAWVCEQTIRPTERRLLAKLVPTSADRECYMVGVTDPHGRILGFIDRNRYYFFQIAPQLYSRGWVDPVPDPLLLRKSGSTGNRTRTSGSVAKNSDH
jgi:hypothetical protein